MGCSSGNSPTPWKRGPRWRTSLEGLATGIVAHRRARRGSEGLVVEHDAPPPPGALATDEAVPHANRALGGVTRLCPRDGARAPVPREVRARRRTPQP